jgi:hypothetical protein
MTTNRPLPEAIDGLPWEVTIRPPQALAQGLLYGVTNLTEQKMILPPENHPSAQYVRLHELAHAKWTPRNIDPAKAAKAAKATVTDIQICEDLRIQTLLHEAGLLPPEVSHRDPNDIQQMSQALTGHTLHEPHTALEVLTWATIAASVAVRHKGIRTPSKYKLAHPPALHGELETVCEQVRNAIDRTGDLPAAARWENIESLANSIANAVVGDAYPKRKSALPFKATTIPAARRLREMLDEAKDTLQQPTPVMPHHDKVPSKHKWGDLAQLPPIPLAASHKPKQAPVRIKRSQIHGTRLGALRRLFTDGRAFHRIAKSPQIGGTVLIDASGSMDLSAEDINAILDKAPAATVAMYSGSADRGAVTVIAKAGRMATNRAIHERRKQIGHGNIVDGPALRWLATQAEPRIWICDGIVTGVNDRQALNLVMETNSLTRQHNIKRHNSVSRYLDAIRHAQQGT